MVGPRRRKSCFSLEKFLLTPEISLRYLSSRKILLNLDMSVSSSISPALGLLRVILHTLGEVPDQREKCKYEISVPPPTLTPTTMHFSRKSLLECPEKPKCGNAPQHCHYQLCHFEVFHGPADHPVSGLPISQTDTNSTILQTTVKWQLWLKLDFCQLTKL